MNKILSWLLFIVLSLTWGSSFILMKRGLEVFTPIQVAALRICFAGIFLLPFAIYHIRKIGLNKHWKAILTVGLFGNFFPAFLFTTAQSKISSSLAGILNALTPIFTMLLAIIVFKNAFYRIQIGGIVIGFLGAIFLLLSKQTIQHNANPLLGWLIVLATFFYAISVNTIKNCLANVNSIAISSIAFLFILIPALMLLFSTNVVHTVNSSSNALKALGYLALLGIWGTAIAVVLYNMLIKNTGILFASSVTYFIPIVALFWGILDGESFYFSQLISIVLIIAGVYLVNRNNKPK